jgi:N-acetylglucosaminyldiphosphoundecaprenol N-acetyl-beta-D-mannosaminyltransferase
MSSFFPELPDNSVEFFGYKIFNTTLDKIDLRLKVLISTLNQYSFSLAASDNTFKQALLGSDILLPDGVGIVMAVKYFGRTNIRKIAGADLHQFFLEKLNKEAGSCFYLGSSEATLTKIRKRIAEENPNIRFGCYSPPFKAAFSAYENSAMVAAVNDFQPDILFVGMTAPKQEKWAFAHKDVLQANTICSIGAVFDFYAGTVKRPGDRWIKLGFEWLGRLIKEPKRMWKRYLIYGPLFLFLLLKEKTKMMLPR